MKFVSPSSATCTVPCYGEHQSDLVAALEAENPHVVLLLGDIFDQRGIGEHSIDLIRVLSGKFNCQFIPGNHEYKSGDLGVIRDLLKKKTSRFSRANRFTRGQRHACANLRCGRRHGRQEKQLQQIADAAAQKNDDIYSILAIHVPNGVESYLHYGFDLMLSGHTHGGQIRIPVMLNGLYAPGQGVFPKYGGGRYDFGKQPTIISRGLSQKPLWLPRLGNPPELTFVISQARTINAIKQTARRKARCCCFSSYS
ncbi:MAG: metallophosphoesterase [Eubacteriales bacterium]